MLFIEGLQEDVQKFFIFLLTVNLASITSASIAFAVSAGSSVTGVATLLIGMIFVLCMVCEHIILPASYIMLFLNALQSCLEDS